MLKYLYCLTIAFAWKFPQNVPINLCSDDNKYCSATLENSTYTNATMDTFEEVLFATNRTKVLFYGDIMTTLHWQLLGATDNLTKVHATDKELQTHLNMNKRTPFSIVYVKTSNEGQFYYETYSWNPTTWTPTRMYQIFLKAEESSLIPEYTPNHVDNQDKVLNLTYFSRKTTINPLELWVVLYYTDNENEDVRNISKWFNTLKTIFGPNVHFYCHDLSVRKTPIRLDYIPTVGVYSSYYKEKDHHFVKMMPPITLEYITSFIYSNIQIKMENELKIKNEEDVERVLKEYK